MSAILRRPVMVKCGVIFICPRVSGVVMGIDIAHTWQILLRGLRVPSASISHVLGLLLTIHGERITIRDHITQSHSTGVKNHERGTAAVQFNHTSSFYLTDGRYGRSAGRGIRTCMVLDRGSRCAGGDAAALRYNLLSLNQGRIL